jgi:hypothetical protein
MEILSNSEEYDIYNSDAMKNYIEFKWFKVGRGHHAFGAVVHFVYIVYMAWYVNQIYIMASLQTMDNHIKFNAGSMVFAGAIFYPAVYETM